MKLDPRSWTQEDLGKIFAAIQVLQDYDLDTSSTTTHLTHIMPDPLGEEEPSKSSP